jgi:hypothetical protein
MWCLVASHVFQVMTHHLLLFRGLSLHALMTRHIGIHTYSKRGLTTLPRTLVSKISLCVFCAYVDGAFLVVEWLLLKLMRERGRVLA